MQLKAPVGGCTVRMYRHGLGDCFLLAFGLADELQKYMLIDCGVLLGTPDASAVMQRVVQDIRQATQDHLDALVVTHEHWDHVSGFVQARDEFAQIRVDQVWLAWTEDPTNPLANTLRQRRNTALQGLRVALAKMPTTSLYAARIQDIDAFFGSNLGVAGKSSTEDALEWIKQKWPMHRYCEPGKVLELANLPNVRFFVLGPPSDPKLIRRSSPSERPGEVYLDDAMTGALGAYLKVLGAAPSGPHRATGESRDEGSPFNQTYKRDKTHADVREVAERYNAEDWRQIEGDWFGAAGELALQLDAHTNNTSLVLAVELSRGGKVLLFPGDAQVGNWLSWDSIPWSREAVDITADELLKRTVLYKVGHHGSHNATLQRQGLEQMTNRDLAAIIPVNREMAAKKRWRMPYLPLYERLQELTQGRVVLADAGPPTGTSTAFLADCIATNLYIDVTVRRDS